MIVAITREPARAMTGCELTYLERRPVDAALAAEQHRAYRETLAACGARVVALPAVEELPDSVFVEDTAVVLDELAVLTSPGSPSRRGEVGLIEPEVARLRPVERISLPARIEGGDVLRVGRRLFIGLSPRTNLAGAEALRRLAARVPVVYAYFSNFYEGHAPASANALKRLLDQPTVSPSALENQPSLF